MWETLNLLANILKYSLVLTIVRLATTAFGWEFGISRQYLRLLELLFQFGQKRIEKVESEHKLHRTVGVRFEQEVPNGSKSFTDREDSQEIGQSSRGELRTPLAEKNAQRPASLLPNGQVCEPDSQQSQGDEPSVVPKKAPMRRISTPDGPPVFLLDDFIGEQDENSLSGPVVNEHQHEFQLIDACSLVVCGVSAIIDDQVTKRFTPEELKTWNLLTRTNAKNYQFMSGALGLYWFVGFLVRYTLLMPLRIMFTITGFVWLVSSMTFVGLIPENLRERPYRLLSLMSMRMLSCGITSRLEFHNPQYRAKKGDICVANHTSPLDVVLLACDNCYALVGQRHGGLLGILECALSRATNHVWFDRGEMRDRQLVTQKLKEHVSSKSNLPVLIFPEGTCINNSAVMMFRKGSFETTDRVCPVAIKYDARFGDPFWNSSQQSYIQYLLLMMSSWAIKCDVWYLPPMERLAGESSAEFACRVKAEIAKQAGLPDLAWDGQLKRSAPKVLWKYQQQEDIANRLKIE